MPMINLTIKGDKVVCCVQNNNKIEFILYKNFLKEIRDLSINYTGIFVDEKNISFSNSKLVVNIANYKSNTNEFFTPLIHKLRKEHRELKKNQIRKQKVKRFSAISGTLIISGIMITNIINDYLAINDKNKDYIDTDIIVTTTSETKDPTLPFTEEKTNENISSYETDNIKEYEINFESDIDSIKLQNVKTLYGEKIAKYAKEFGIDEQIMMAIATQEYGIDSWNLDGPGVGLMQIELKEWDGKDLRVFNYEREEYENVHITAEKLLDVDFNIRTACMIFRNCLTSTNYNLLAAIQKYNFGHGNVENVFKETYGNDIDFYETCENCDNSWLEYREIIKEGDSEYLEKILSYIEDLDDIEVKKEKEIVKFSIKNKSKRL